MITRIPTADNPPRHGFTLVEMLVTLTLLVVLMMVSISWVMNIIKHQEEDMRRSNWRQAAFMMLDQLERDLMQADMLDESRRLNLPRVRVERDEITIRTIEHGGLVAIKYYFDQNRRQLVRQIDSDRMPQTPLLGDVERLHAELQRPDGRHELPELHLTIESRSGQRLSRVLTLDRKDVQR